MREGQIDLESAEESDRNVIWVPARKYLKHATFSIPGQLSERQKDSALSLKVEAWSPFDDTGYAVAWSGNVACVFAWDKKQVQSQIREFGYDPIKCKVIPEAFIRHNISDGLRLVRCVNGVEGQFWKDGILMASRWWQKTPPVNDWYLFSRIAGQQAGNGLPDIIEPVWLDKAWHEKPNSGDLISYVINYQPARVFATVLLILPVTFFLAQTTTYMAQNWLINKEIAAIEGASQSIRASRLNALIALEAAEDISSLHKYPHQIEILARAHSLLYEHGVTLLSWEYDSGDLEFGLDLSSELDPRVFIKAFENDNLFSNVSASTRGQTLIVKMKIAPSRQGSQNG